MTIRPSSFRHLQKTKLYYAKKHQKTNEQTKIFCKAILPVRKKECPPYLGGVSHLAIFPTMLKPIGL